MEKLKTTPPDREEAERLVRNAVRLVEKLNLLSRQFPGSFKPMARQMAAWPVMRPKRAAENDGFHYVVVHLQLGEDYPLDTSYAARSHPSSIMGRYLTRWVERLHDIEWGSVRVHPNAGCPKRDQRQFSSLLKLASTLPPLNKGTSDEWSRQVMVPIIMLCDAGLDEGSCNEPSLKAIWKQRGVKSVPTFRSRLLARVRQSLRCLARHP